MSFMDAMANVMGDEAPVFDKKKKKGFPKPKGKSKGKPMPKSKGKGKKPFPPKKGK